MTQHRPHLAMQLYSTGSAEAARAALPLLAELGYDGVEVVHAMAPDADAFAPLLQEHGLKARSAHVGLDALEADADGCATWAEALGVRTLVAPWLEPDDRPRAPSEWRALGERLARVGERLQRRSLGFAWHNHDFEFEPLPDATYGLEHLLGSDASVRPVLWEADVAWIVRAGADPFEWLERYRGCVPLIHVKDLAPAGEGEGEDGWADPGHGTLDWQSLWTACEAAGARAVIAEHDRPSDFDRFARRAADTLRHLAGRA